MSPQHRGFVIFVTDVPKDKPLTLHYRLRIRDGKEAVTPEQLATGVQRLRQAGNGDFRK